MKIVKRRRIRYSTRSLSLLTGVISKIIPENGYKSFEILHVNKHGSKKKHKCSPKPLTPYASWYKMFGYKDLDELYQITKRGKYREGGFMELEYIYCSSCGYEDFDKFAAYSRRTANGDWYYCPVCGQDSINVDDEDDE